MPIVTIGAICTSIHETMEEISDLEQVQNYNEITEGMNTYPTLQVYWESIEADVNGDTSASTLCKGVSQTDIIFHLDLYARQRSQIAEGMQEVTDLSSLIHDKLQEQTECDSPPNCVYFGNEAIRSYHWTASRVVFEYGTVLYPGARFILTVRIF